MSTRCTEGGFWDLSRQSTDALLLRLTHNDEDRRIAQHLATRFDRALKAEADCAALRDLLQRAQAWVAEDTPLQDLIATALQATNAGKPLLDELARLRAERMELVRAGTLDANELRTKLEAAESALRLAREALEQVAEPQPMMSITECASKRRRIAEQAIAALDRITGKLP